MLYTMNKITMMQNKSKQKRIRKKFHESIIKMLRKNSQEISEMNSTEIFSKTPTTSFSMLMELRGAFPYNP